MLRRLSGVQEPGRRSYGGMRQVMEESELLQIITAVDEDAVKRLLDVYREPWTN